MTDDDVTSAPPADGAAPFRRRPPAGLVVALLLVLVELGTMVALAAALVLEAVTGASRSPSSEVIMAVLFLVLAALLAAGARALHRGLRWGRGPVITWQLLLLAIGVSQAPTLVWWLVVLLVVVPVAIVVGSLLPASVRWTTATPPPAG